MTPEARIRLSAADLRERLPGRPCAPDPSQVDLEAATRRWRPGFRERLREDLVPAAVLIPIVPRPQGLAVLLVRRSATLRHHAGQIGFPGGRMEPGDADVAATALREAHEELGIPPHRVEVAGFLPAVPTLSGYAVTPVIGLLAAIDPPAPDGAEVEGVLEVPLPHLLDPANQRRGVEEAGRVAVPDEFHFEGHRIWGVTADIVLALRDRLLPGARPA